MLFSPVLRRSCVFLTLAVVSIITIGIWLPGNTWPSTKQNGLPLNIAKTHSNKLHFVVPATSSNRYLCQLLLSAVVLGYPEPVLINWGTPEDRDDYIQHLAKVDGILNYLNTLGPHQENDLFLMVDGYDAWFQLPPDILIQRYASVVDASRNRYPHKSWKNRFTSGGPVDTVIFGQDKISWPGTKARAAYWAVPDSPLWHQAFGPDTDHGIPEHNRPRWLNSGTIMGPVKDVRAVFAATRDKITENHIENSDQFYFANVFADQSYARGPTKTQRWPEQPDPLEEGVEPLEIPNIPADRDPELGIGLDYESALFQTVAYYEAYITWIRYNQSSEYMSTTSKDTNPYHYFPLPEYLKTSSPADMLDLDASQINLDSALSSWASVPLGTNTITKHVFPIIHFTGKKGYREMWWHRNWFFPYAEMLLKMRREGTRGAGDALTTGSGVLPWEELCGAHENFLFGKIL